LLEVAAEQHAEDRVSEWLASLPEHPAFGASHQLDGIAARVRVCALVGVMSSMFARRRGPTDAGARTSGPIDRLLLRGYLVPWTTKI
jgi:hypothetical protein